MNKNNSNDWSGWRRNVIDSMKHMSSDQIRTDLLKKSRPFSVLMEHWAGDFNIGTMIRNSNAFGARKVFYLGKKKYDRRGTVGTHHYVDLQFLPSFDDLEGLLEEERWNIVCFENIPGAIDLRDFEWPINPIMVFGEEKNGISDEMLNISKCIVKIPQCGSVRSLNVGTASGIAMYDWSFKNAEDETI